MLYNSQIRLSLALLLSFCAVKSAYAHRLPRAWPPPGGHPHHPGPNPITTTSTDTASTTPVADTIIPVVSESAAQASSPAKASSPVQASSPVKASSPVQASSLAQASSQPSTGAPPPSTGGIAKGFNYDAAVDFATEFATAKNLVGASGFNSARLYTMIEPGSTNTPISAIQAAINTGTTLLLGLYCSKGDAAFTQETEALATAITQYGTAFTDLIIGISVGSEDLYRSSVTTDGVGDTPSNINKYIAQTRAVLTKANLNKLVGHVDTSGIWLDSSSGGQVLPNIDFVGVDSYPYWQNVTPSDALSAFTTSIQQVTAAVGSKPVWITETGWPVTGPSQGPAVPSVANAKSYWDGVGCLLFGKTNTWWYTLNDAGLTGSAPSFGITSSPSDTTPLFSLAC